MDKLKRISKFIWIPVLFAIIGIFYARSVLSDAYYKPVATTSESTDEHLSFDNPNEVGLNATIENASPFQLTVLDVGNALCVLIESNGEYMLFDGGDSETSSYVVSYMKWREIPKFKYIVASHYHADHVYGLIGILENFEVKDVISPDYVSATNAYTKFTRRSAPSTHIHPYVGQTFNVGDVELKCICPVDDAYQDENGYSVGFVGTYKDFKFLINGDAESESESDMLKEDLDLNVDLLIVPHHGSMYSSSAEWLEKVSPKVAIISCGKDNDYGHPHKLTLDRLKECGVEYLFRTDLNGAISVTVADDNTFSVVTEKEATEDALWTPGILKEEGVLDE